MSVRKIGGSKSVKSSFFFTSVEFLRHPARLEMYSPTTYPQDRLFDGHDMIGGHGETTE